MASAVRDYVDDTGKLQTRRDVYNLDSRTLAAIKSERAIIDPFDRKRTPEMAYASSRKSAGSSRNPPVFQSISNSGPSDSRPLAPRAPDR